MRHNNRNVWHNIWVVFICKAWAALHQYYEFILLVGITLGRNDALSYFMLHSVCAQAPFCWYCLFTNTALVCGLHWYNRKLSLARIWKKKLDFIELNKAVTMSAVLLTLLSNITKLSMQHKDTMIWWVNNTSEFNHCMEPWRVWRDMEMLSLHFNWCLLNKI